MPIAVADMSLKQRRVLWACLQCWKESSRPIDERDFCYEWVIGRYREQFAESFHQAALQQLARMGLLEKLDATRGGDRRYYTFVDAAQVESLITRVV